MEADKQATVMGCLMNMKKILEWLRPSDGLSAESFIASELRLKHQPTMKLGKDSILDHIILDMTGSSVPLEEITNASAQRAFRRKRRLLRRSNTVLVSRLAIMVLVTILVMVTTLLTWYFTSVYSARSIKSLAVVLRRQLLDSSLQGVTSILGEVYNTTLALSSLHQQVYLSAQNYSWGSVELELRKMNRGVFYGLERLSSVAFISHENCVTDYTRSHGQNYFFFVNETNDGSSPVWYYQNATGNYNDTDLPPPEQRSNGPLGARLILQHHPLEVTWTIARSISGEPVVFPAVPLRRLDTGDILGLSAITILFSYIRDYLSNIDLLGGFLYIEWRNGTDGSSLLAISYDGPSDSFVSPQNATNPVVAAAAKFLASKYGPAVGCNETHSDSVILVGNKYYVDSMPLIQEPFRSLNLTAVVIIPRRSIMGKIDTRNHAVVVVTIITALSVLVVGCCFICLVTSKISTEMHLRQELIRQLVAKQHAEQSSNYKSQFLANMSHELRTPMAGIIGLLDLLSCDSLTAEQEVSVTQIRRCATGLLDLVNNVLDISKVEAGRLELESSVFSVASELKNLVDVFATQSFGTGVEVTLDLSDDIPHLIKGDSKRIKQIFTNLLSNSVKFTTSGHVLVRGWVDQSLLDSGVRAEVLPSRSTRSWAGEKIALVFEVDDTGCGIPYELREMVFDSFVQGDGSSTRSYGGSGLGLYIVRSLVQLMGGNVIVAAKEDPGTLIRFHVVLDEVTSPSLAEHPELGRQSMNGLREMHAVDGLGGPIVELSHGDGAPEIHTDAPQMSFEEWSPVIELNLGSRSLECSGQVVTPKVNDGMCIGMPLVNKTGKADTVPDVRVSQLIGPSASKALASLHILLVEDTPVLQRLAGMMLKKLGAHVTVVGDGLQAVTAVAEADASMRMLVAATKQEDREPEPSESLPQFDLILMDCAMPVMDGYSATEAIRAAEANTGRHIPIVALTAHALASDEERCLSVGMDAYLTKPINCKLMVSTIQELVTKQ